MKRVVGVLLCVVALGVPLRAFAAGDVTISQGAGGGEVTISNPALDQAASYTWSGYHNFSGGTTRLPEATVAGLPSAGASAGKVFVVTDAASAGNCGSGGGSSRALCRSNGTSWEAIGGGGGGAPTGATYLVGSGDATLTAEQVLTDGTGVSLSLNTAPDPDTLTLALAPAEVGSVTWLDNADRTWTFDVAAAGTNPTLAFSNNQIALGGNLDVAGTIEAGSGNNVITTAAGLVDATKLTGLVPLASGGTNLSGALDDNVMVGNATTWESKALPSCSNGTTQKLLYNTTTNAFSCGTDQTGGGGATQRAGIVTLQGGGATVIIGITMPDTTYAVLLTPEGVTTSDENQPDVCKVDWASLTTTTFDIRCFWHNNALLTGEMLISNSVTAGVYWQVIDY